MVAASLRGDPAAQASQSGLFTGESANDNFQPVRMVRFQPLPKIGYGLSGLPKMKRVADPPTKVPQSLGDTNVRINNDNGFSCNEDFTQSETTIVAFGDTIVAGFNDSGSFASGDHFTGWSRSTDNGATWTDGGRLPDSPFGDVGDPSMARDNTMGRIYFAALGLTLENTIPVFRSDDDGATWQAPINGTPGKSGLQDKEWIAVDNFSGDGNGNLYLVERDFGAGNAIYFFRSTDGGSSFAPNGGTLIVPGMQGAFVTVSPDHSVHAFWYDGAKIKVRKSTDHGLTFAAPVIVATFVDPGGINGDLGLTGVLNGGQSVHFRSDKFPHVAVNPVSGNIYVAYDDKGTGADKADIFFVQSTDGGVTWSAPTEVNDDATITDQWSPSIVVSPSGDTLGIFYYSRQDDTANNNLFRYYGRIATISGGTVTFAPSVAVSDVQSLPEVGRDAEVNSLYMGDYDSAAATSGFFHIVWSDNRADLPGCPPIKDPDVYYDKIVLGQPTPTASPTPIPTATPTPTPTPSATVIPTPTATPTPTARPTPTPRRQPSVRPRPSPAPRP